jgi:hypothetical protein
MDRRRVFVCGLRRELGAFSETVEEQKVNAERKILAALQSG